MGAAPLYARSPPSNHRGMLLMRRRQKTDCESNGACATMRHAHMPCCAGWLQHVCLRAHACALVAIPSHGRCRLLRGLCAWRRGSSPQPSSCSCRRRRDRRARRLSAPTARASVADVHVCMCAQVVASLTTAAAVLAILGSNRRSSLRRAERTGAISLCVVSKRRSGRRPDERWRDGGDERRRFCRISPHAPRARRAARCACCACACGHAHCVDCVVCIQS